METCSTVEEVLTIFDQYNLDFMADFQYFIVDCFGNSAIIEGDEIINRETNYQVITNFLQSNPGHGWYPCWRYNIAVNMLENMEQLTVGYFTSICEATHQEGAYPTVYSYVNDLQNNIMYLYHYYNYDNVVIIDVNEEISQGEHSYYLPNLFQPEQNHPPEIPKRPSGPSTGRVKNEYSYSVSTTDPDDNRILYLFDWDDGTDSGWLGPYESGEECHSSHSWISQGAYNIRVKAKDVYNAESEWSDPLSVSMPKTRQYLFSWFYYFLENHPYMFPLIRQLLKL
jgi:hypothetical protein